MKTFLIPIFIFGFIATAFNPAYGATANTVDLLWEGETYVPTFYAGRPLPTAGNLVRVVAMPMVTQNGQRLRVERLIFQWVKDFNPIQSASGLGKNVLEYRADQGGGSSIVNVAVLTTQGERLAEDRVIITPTKPKVVLYRETPLTNPSRARGLAGVTPIGSTETTLVAEPFFFSPLDLAKRRDRAAAKRKCSALYGGDAKSRDRASRARRHRTKRRFPAPDRQPKNNSRLWSPRFHFLICAH